MAKKTFILLTLFLSCIALYAIRSPVKNSGGNPETYIIFGKYCGECIHDCAIMFRFETNDNYGRLWMDKTESFFRNKGQVSCKTPITDASLVNIAASIPAKIPAKFLHSNENSLRLGCPDCSDG